MKEHDIKFGELAKVLSDIGAMDLFEPHITWALEDGKLSLSPLAEITGDTDIEIDYYWYHHMMPQKDRQKIEDALHDGNFEEFKKWFRRLLCEPSTYLPTQATVACGGVIIGDLNIMCREELFDLITYEEAECG